MAAAAALTLNGVANVHAQAIDPALLTSSWPARWIAPAGAPPRAVGVYHFRHTFDLTAVPPAFVIHASGDQRYQLFVNGTRVASGPARADLDHWPFETIDIAPQLRSGANVLAAVVWNFGEQAPMAQVSHRTALIVQGNSRAEHFVNTGPSPLSTVRASVPTPRRVVSVEYAAGRRLVATITLPADVSGELQWQGRTIPLRPGRQQLELERRAPTPGVGTPTGR